MDKRNKLRIRSLCLASVFPAAAGVLICGLAHAQSQAQAQSQSMGGQPAGPVTWNKPNGANGSTTPSQVPASTPPNYGSPEQPLPNGAMPPPYGYGPGMPPQYPNPAMMTSPVEPWAAPFAPPAPGPTLAPPPSNPLLLLDPVNGGNNASAYYDESGHLQMGKTTPEPILPDYRESPFPQPQNKEPLTYFGYDYFKPAQDLIEARLNAMMFRYYAGQTAMTANYQPQGNGSTQQNGPSPNYPQYGSQLSTSPYGNQQQPTYGQPSSTQPYNTQPYNSSQPGVQSPYGAQQPYNQQYGTPQSNPQYGTQQYNSQYGTQQYNAQPPNYGTNPATAPGQYGSPSMQPSIPGQPSPYGYGNGYNYNYGYGSSGYGYPQSPYSGYPQMQQPQGYQPGTAPAPSYQSNTPYGSNNQNNLLPPYASGQTQGVPTPQNNGQGYTPYGSQPTFPNSPNGQSYPGSTNQNTPGGLYPGGLPAPSLAAPYGINPGYGNGLAYPGGSANPGALPGFGAAGSTPYSGTPAYPGAVPPPGGVFYGQPQFAGSAPGGLQPQTAYPPSTYPSTGASPFNAMGSSVFAQQSALNNPQMPQQQQVDIYSGRVAGPLDLMSFLPAGGAVPQTYELASGDELTIRIWSTTMPAQEIVSTVEPNGTLTIPGIGNFVVRGQTTDQAEHALRERIQRLFRGGDVSVALNKQRTMVVTITGAAFLPGSYLVPASQTAYNVLYAAGGPSLEGSMRSVEVRRAGQLMGTIDLYNYLGVGGKSHDIPLEPGDVIYIPNRYSSVAVTGEVRKPAIFELKPGETLKDALHFAGGVKAGGVTQRVQIDTVDPGAARVLRDIDIKDLTQLASTTLYDGDEVDVFSVRSDVANRVTIEGAVDQEGDYALAPGMTVSELISRARGTRYNAYTARADLYRWNDDNTLTLISINLDKAIAHDPANDIALKRWDRLKVYGRDELTWTASRQVRIRGAVQREGIYYRSDNMHASDLLRMAGGPLPEAYLDRVVLLHQHSDGSFSYDYVDASGWANGDFSNDPMIADNDVLAVYRDSEAHFTADHTVRIDGEVVAPGVYPRGDHMHVSDLIKLAGGFTPKAGTIVMVAHPNKVLPAGTGAAARLATKKAVSVMSDEVVFDNDKMTASNDIALHDGDVVTVQGVGGFRTQVRLVYVDGRVNRPGPVPMTPNMRLSDLIAAAGGLMPDAFVDGAEFYRDPTLLGSASQQTVAQLVGNVTDVLNANAYQRALAVSDINRVQAVSSNNQDDNGGLAIPGISAPAAATNGAAGAAAATATFKQPRDLVTPPRLMSDPQTRPIGNLAVDVGSAIDHPGSASDIVLEEGDTITIPMQPTTVQVAGAVFNPRSVVFSPGAGVDYYIAQAGGMTPDAANKNIEVIHPGGGLVPANKVRRLHAGDMVLVPTKVLAANIQSHQSTWENLFKTALGAAVVIRLLAP